MDWNLWKRIDLCLRKMNFIVNVWIWDLLVVLVLILVARCIDLSYKKTEEAQSLKGMVKVFFALRLRKREMRRISNLKVYCAMVLRDAKVLS